MITILLIISLSFFSHSQELESSTTDATRQTQEMLKDSTKRKELLKNKNAKEANENAQNLIGSENMDEMYGVVSEILPLIVKESAGDSTKMTRLLAEFQKNPEAFYKKLPPEIQAKIKSLSKKAEKKSQRAIQSP